MWQIFHCLVFMFLIFCLALIITLIFVFDNHVSPFENTNVCHLLFEWHLWLKWTFADGCHCENVYILWNRLDRTCYKCIIRLHNYVPYEALKPKRLCLGFPHNSHKLCLKIAMIIINKCCIAHWTVLIHISMYCVRFSVLLIIL